MSISGQRSKKTEFNAEVEDAQITQGRKDLNMFEKGERSVKLQLAGEHRCGQKGSWSGSEDLNILVADKPRQGIWILFKVYYKAMMISLSTREIQFYTVTDMWRLHWRKIARKEIQKNGIIAIQTGHDGVL